MESHEIHLVNKNRRPLKPLLPLEKPLSIFIEPSNMCNFRCAPCVHGNELTRKCLEPFCNMEVSVFQRIAGEIKEWNGPKLNLMRLAVLGEPLVHPNFSEFVRIAKQMNIADKVDTFTNASLLNRDISEKLVEYQLDAIRVSIYSVIQERHDTITRTNFSIEKIRDNIRQLKDIRDKAGSKKPFIIVKAFDNYNEENELFIKLYSNIADETGFEKITNAANYGDINLIDRYYGDQRKNKATQEAYSKGLNEHIACPRPFMALVINSAGDVLMCTQDSPKKTKIGSVYKQNLLDIWFGKELYEFRKIHLENEKHKNELCKNCDWYKLFPAEDNVDGLAIEIFKSK